MDQDVGSIILQNAPKNEMICCQKIQKDIVDACAKEKIKAIIEDLDGDFFGILVDDSKDISHKEQMGLILETIYSFLSNHSLSPSQVRGQGYDGASNMQGELNGLKNLILCDTLSAYSTYYFSHQLQLTLVALEMKNSDKLENFIDIFPSILYVLEFAAFLKKTNSLNSSLQNMDQDIVNAMGLLNTAKQELQMMRESEWQSLLDDVFSFCDKHEILILKIDARYILGKSKHRALDITYSHHFRVGFFYGVIDFLLQELNSRFNVPNEFDNKKLRDLSCQLDNFIVYVRGSDKRFFNIKGITDLANALAQSELHQTWPLV
ncbi:uncharacterized protein LOC132612763 [Lycium barbarum]|uniref:uncharacterized protein LOC132612763 n=1 Tax=Lycium barbarum TaxID=112863 RepID=UPI00293EC04A|nr:uncharacterized protein LOC132612763 [Lycium barbarum]